jgi:hypothetical protein
MMQQREQQCISKSFPLGRITAWNQNLLNETVGADMVCNVVCLPSVGASGGILIVASEQFFKVQQTHQTLNTVFASITMLAENKV